MLTWAPELWPETAAQWSSRYETQFWEKGWMVAGFREFPKGYDSLDWYLFDVDAGPVLAGYGTAASAFGIGAARVNGHVEQAYPLSAEALVATWPLPNGTLLMPRLLSNLSDAPYTGEAALLFVFTRRAMVPTHNAGALRLPLCVYIGIGVYILKFRLIS